mmetsp:Transcript_12353/g.26016  ORF Transcript_12353/g.26016 Transcript_12353/m.26016 type:complete len:216 (-) Transcript_12353:1438-2085(-)
MEGSGIVALGPLSVSGSVTWPNHRIVILSSPPTESKSKSESPLPPSLHPPIVLQRQCACLLTRRLGVDFASRLADRRGGREGRTEHGEEGDDEDFAEGAVGRGYGVEEGEFDDGGGGGGAEGGEGGCEGEYGGVAGALVGVGIANRRTPGLQRHCICHPGQNPLRQRQKVRALRRRQRRHDDALGAQPRPPHHAPHNQGGQHYPGEREPSIRLGF